MPDETPLAQICQGDDGRQNDHLPVARNSEIPDYSNMQESRRPLWLILHVGVEKILDDEIQPRKRKGRRGRMLVNGARRPILRPGEYGGTLTKLLADLILECDSISQLNPLIRQHIEERQNDTTLRPGDRFVQEVTEIDLQAALTNLRKARRNNDVPRSDEPAQNTLKRKIRTDSLVGGEEAQEPFSKKPRSNPSAADEEQDIQEKSKIRDSRGGKVRRKRREKGRERMEGERENGAGEADILEARGGVPDDISKEGTIAALAEHSTGNDDAGSRIALLQSDKQEVLQPADHDHTEQHEEGALSSYGDVLSASNTHASSAWLLKLLSKDIQRLEQLNQELERKGDNRAVNTSSGTSSFISNANRIVEMDCPEESVNYLELRIRIERSRLEHERDVKKKSIQEIVSFLDQQRFISGVCISRSLRRRVNQLLADQQQLGRLSESQPAALQRILDEFDVNRAAKEPSLHDL